MSSISSSGSPYTNSQIEALIARAIGADDAEEGDSVKSEGDSSGVFDLTQDAITTASPAPAESPEYFLQGRHRLEDIESPDFPATHPKYEECTPVYIRSQPTALTFCNELQKVYLELSKHMKRQDIELLSYTPDERKTLISLIELFRANMTGNHFYEVFFQSVQTRFAQPIFKDYFHFDC